MNEALSFFHTRLSALPGVGEKRALLLARLGLHTIADALFHAPSGLVDRRQMPPLSAAAEGQIITAVVEVDKHVPARHPSRGQPYRVVCHNEDGVIELIFFRAPGDYVEKALPVGQTRVISGRVEFYGSKLIMPHPDYIVPEARFSEVCKVEAVYPLTAGISNKFIANLIRKLLEKMPPLPEWQEATLHKKREWEGFCDAITALHSPVKAEQVGPTAKERLRLAYDEILAHQLAMAIARTKRAKQRGVVLPAKGELAKALIQSLPFTLTKGQQEAVAEIAKEMAGGNRMVRLLQGDVGSGKTLVALLSMLQAVEAGGQGVLMAPTEILARQHAETITKLMAPFGIHVALLTSQVTAKKTIQKKLASGEIQIAIGTHALIEAKIEFHRLGLVVIDEQHRFGVQQRLRLIEKQPGVHVLMMSATPIPRTLALTYYGDMDISILAEKPAGRKPIDTRTLPLSRLPEVAVGLKRAIDSGARIYWICPLVEESEMSDLAAAEARFQDLSQLYPRVGLVHGRMKQAARAPVMEAFRTGELDILVATTVIEVGVDVPEATVMVIEHAERFGLSQLHQLRGRVGRGEKPSSCLLLYAEPLGKVARSRLDIMRQTEDGFLIAEEDLKLRGIGDVLGTKQSGFPAFRLADLAVHASLLPAARDEAAYQLNRDPKLGEKLRVLLSLFGYHDDEMPARLKS